MAILAQRQVPTIDGNPTYMEISLRWIDAVGDIRSDVVKIDSKASDLDIEALIATTMGVSHASLYTVRVTKVYAGEKSKSNANASPYFSVDDSIVYHVKDLARNSRRASLPGPKKTRMVPGTTAPNMEDASLLGWLAAWDTLFAGTFSPVSVRFTQRREIGKKKDL